MLGKKCSQSLKNININVYYGGPLVNREEIDGFPFRGSGIECYYMMIRRKLKTLNDLKRKIMEELNLNPACYDIKIIYHYPQEVLHERINYGYMAIKEDKHVKLMFNRIHKMPQVNAAELYVSSEQLAEVDTEEGRKTKMKTKTKTKTKIMLRIMVKILMIWMSTKRGLSKATLTGMWITMNSFPILKRKIWSTMMKVWDAKQKAIAKIFRDWEESYQRLRKLLLAYLDQDSGTQYNYYTIPRGIDGTALLRYVFWAFAPCIAAFRCCRPVISIDGTHLYGKYRGVLMIAMATDANQKVLPLAFAVVDKESGAS
ncbi:hypothetical protein SO802_017799 [Lithocarpus litseifolius]|uniref:MULE transposase domain-containing protein n=1 Tax=Lithocarpus litseifolius TaxID=425828 RepID=A0AAW2CJI8_9ROSI